MIDRLLLPVKATAIIGLLTFLLSMYLYLYASCSSGSTENSVCPNFLTKIFFLKIQHIFDEFSKWSKPNFWLISGIFILLLIAQLSLAQIWCIEFWYLLFGLQRTSTSVFEKVGINMKQYSFFGSFKKLAVPKVVLCL